MIPILAGLLSTLASNGLGVLAGAITSKGKEFVEDKIGMKIPNDPTLEQMVELKKAEMQHEEVLLELAIKKAQISLEELKIEVDNTKDARKMNASIQSSEHASYISKVAPYWIDFIIVGSTLVSILLLYFVGVPASNAELAYMAIGSLITMCGTILNFHRGTSSSSKNKDDTINSLTKGVL